MATVVPVEVLKVVQVVLLIKIQPTLIQVLLIILRQLIMLAHRIVVVPLKAPAVAIVAVVAQKVLPAIPIKTAKVLIVKVQVVHQLQNYLQH